MGWNVAWHTVNLRDFSILSSLSIVNFGNVDGMACEVGLVVLFRFRFLLLADRINKKELAEKVEEDRRGA